MINDFIKWYIWHDGRLAEAYEIMCWINYIITDHHFYSFIEYIIIGLSFICMYSDYVCFNDSWVFSCSPLMVPVSCVDLDGLVNDSIIIIIDFNLQSPYCYINNSIYNSSSYYILPRECSTSGEIFIIHCIVYWLYLCFMHCYCNWMNFLHGWLIV
jgi:hypothetical protein